MNTTKTPATEHAEQVAMLQVFTTPQKPDERHEIVEASARNGKNDDGTPRIVDNANRFRCIIIPTLSVDGVPSKFQSLVMSALRATAAKQFDSIWKADPMVREVPAAIWSVDSLLLFAARETESKRLSKETIAAWYETSQLCAKLTAKNNDKMVAKYLAECTGLAAAVFSYTPKRCTELLGLLVATVTDEDDAIGLQLIAKLQRKLEEYAKQDEDTGEVPTLD
jgi:hypothetical protein